MDAQPKQRITRYDAPETTPDGFVRRVLCIPVDDDYRIIAAVNDVLGYLTLPNAFNPSDVLSDEYMQSLMTEMFLGYFGELEIMIGAVVPMATDVLPSFMVWCEGQTLLRANYPDLYGRLNPVFVIDEDSFTVPDLRERFVFGAGVEGETAYDIGGTGGQATVELTESEMPVHYHLTHSHTTILGVAPGEAPISAPSPLSEGSGNAGLGNAHDNMPPYFVLRYAMVAKWRDCC